jgi:hypothetical protein
MARSHRILRRFNDSYLLRVALAKRGLLKRESGSAHSTCSPLKQEVNSCMLLLRGLDHVTSELTTLNGSGFSLQDQLGSICKFAVTSFLDRDQALRREGNTPELTAMAQESLDATTPIILTALKSIQALSDEEIRRNSYWVYSSLVQLIRCDSSDVRDLVHEIFTARLALITPKVR